MPNVKFDDLECRPSRSRKLRADRQVQWFNGQSKPSVEFDLMLNSGCRVARCSNSVNDSLQQISCFIPRFISLSSLSSSTTSTLFRLVQRWSRDFTGCFFSVPKMRFLVCLASRENKSTVGPIFAQSANGGAKNCYITLKQASSASGGGGMSPVACSPVKIAAA